MKNIVLCCDGTDNQFAGDQTNVIRTYKVLVRSDDQATYYDPGVGTLPQPGFVTKLGQRCSILMGLAFGVGFAANIESAYRYLMETWKPGDRIFLFGFSRGAYTVRALAGMLHSVGLLRYGSEDLVPYARVYWQKDRGPDSPGGKLCADFKATMARDCPVHFIGVWDTVGSVGLINHFRTFPFTAHNPSVTSVRHAVSIDERRCCFRQNLMDRYHPDQDVINVWFSGVHADVGGGYRPSESGLAKIAFEWIIRTAVGHGLQVDQAALNTQINQVGEPPNPRGILHNSLTWLWWILEIFPTRHYSKLDRKWHWRFKPAAWRDIAASTGPAERNVHESVLVRMAALPSYRPKNLPADPAAVAAAYKIVP